MKFAVRDPRSQITGLSAWAKRSNSRENLIASAQCPPRRSPAKKRAIPINHRKMTEPSNSVNAVKPDRIVLSQTGYCLNQAVLKRIVPAIAIGTKTTMAVVIKSGTCRKSSKPVKREHIHAKQTRNATKTCGLVLLSICPSRCDSSLFTVRFLSTKNRRLSWKYLGNAQLRKPL